MIKFKKLHPLAQKPKRAHPSDSGADLFSVEDATIAAHDRFTVRTGLSLEFEPGFGAEIRNRSGLPSKTGLIVVPGTIDNSYRGELGVTLINTSDTRRNIMRGERIAQLVVERVIYVDFEEAEIDVDTERGTAGFGSSGQ